MLDAIRKIQILTESIDFEKFIKDVAVHDAVMYNFIVIGEASARLSDEFKKLHNNVEWHKLRGMRNHLAHGYDEIDYTVIWDTVKSHLHELKTRLAIVLATNNNKL